MQRTCLTAILILSQYVYGWSETTYLMNTTDYLGGPIVEVVYPTAAVTPMSTSVAIVNTSLLVESGYITIPITVSNLFVESGAPIYSITAPWMPDKPTPTTPTATTSIGTRYYGPALVSNPTTCTKTQFTYTAIHSVYIPTELAAQATESVNAAYITSFGGDYSTDLGGQELQTMYSVVYFRAQALGGLLPIDQAEQHYLTECVDPRRYLCAQDNTLWPAIVAATGGCPVPTTSVTYPPFMYPWKTSSSAAGSSETQAIATAPAKKNSGLRTQNETSKWSGVVVILLTVFLLTL